MNGESLERGKMGRKGSTPSYREHIGKGLSSKEPSMKKSTKIKSSRFLA